MSSGSFGGWGSIGVGWWSIVGSVGGQLQVGLDLGGCRFGIGQGSIDNQSSVGWGSIGYVFRFGIG